jgi:hypothetical protein
MINTKKKLLINLPAVKVDKTMEILVSIVLSFASLLTAWNGYQASQWGAEQGRNNNTAMAARVQATRATALATSQRQVDVSVFIAWLEATNAKDQALADFYRARFRDEFRPAFDEWLKSQPLVNADAAPTPFALPSYSLLQMREAEALEQQAGDAAAKAQAANETSTRYVISTLFVAASLFFAGISRTFNYRAVRLVLVVASLFLFLAGLINSVGLPRI